MNKAKAAHSWLDEEALFRPMAMAIIRTQRRTQKIRCDVGMCRFRKYGAVGTCCLDWHDLRNCLYSFYSLHRSDTTSFNATHSNHMFDFSVFFPLCGYRQTFIEFVLSQIYCFHSISLPLFFIFFLLRILF